MPVEVEEGVLTAEEVLKRQLKKMGAEGERYDYVQFEGEARMLPRRTRATLAHCMWPWDICQMTVCVEWPPTSTPG